MQRVLLGVGVSGILLVSIGSILGKQQETSMKLIEGLSLGSGFQGLAPRPETLKDVSAGSVHRYAIPLELGQYLLVVLRQVGADVALVLRGPSGEILREQNSYNGTVGLEVLPWVARKDGMYQVEVVAPSSGVEGGYTLVASKPRVPTDYDLETVAFFENAPLLLHEVEGADPREQAQAFEQVKTLAATLNEPEWLALLDMEYAWEMREASVWGLAADAYQRAFAGYQSLELPWRGTMLGDIAHALGTVLYRKGAFQEAIRWNQEALKWRSEPDLKRAESLIEQSFIHGISGAYQEGQAFLEEVAAILSQHQDLALEHRMLIMKGSFQNAENAPILALETYRQARKLPLGFDLEREVTLLDRESKAFFRLGRYEDALEALLKAQTLVGSEEMRWRAIFACNIAQVLITLERFDEAKRMLRVAESFFSDKVEPATQAFIWFQKAKIYLQEEQTAEALRCMLQCLALSEHIREYSESLSLKATYSAAYHEYQDFLVEVLMRAGQTEEAFRAVEKVRSRNLVQRLRHPKSERIVDPTLNALKKEISERAWQLSNNPAPKPKDLQELNALLWRFNRMRDQSGEVAGQPSDEYEPTSIDFQIVQDMLDEKTTVFYYAFGESQLWLWRIDQGGVEPYLLGLRESLDADALSFFEAARNRDPAPYRDQVRTLGARLAQRLFPADALPVSDSRLVIVADGNLHYLPFAALPLPNNPDLPLVTAYELVHLHSLSVLSALRARPRSVPDWDRAAVFAGPVYHPQSQYMPLPYSLKEADLVKQYGGNEVRLYLGEAATKASYSQMKDNPDLLLMAVHGLSLPEQGDLSALVLSNRASSGDLVDGYLRGHEIAATPLTAKLVVLSSCRSALGQHLRGEGLVGLSQSFLEAGALSVIAGLWDLGDQTTYELMQHFYQGLYQEGLTPAAALRKAQVAMRQTPGFEDAYYWAAFQIQGDWQIAPKE